MAEFLQISSSLSHDGDHCVRLRIGVSNGEMSAHTLVWGNSDSHLDFAEALSGFPESASARVSFLFGTPGTGSCALEFFCIDGLGHVGIWCNVEAPYPPLPGSAHEEAKLFLRCDASSIDDFVSSLRRFIPDTENSAQLTWRGA